MCEAWPAAMSWRSVRASSSAMASRGGGQALLHAVVLRGQKQGLPAPAAVADDPETLRVDPLATRKVAGAQCVDHRCDVLLLARHRVGLEEVLLVEDLAVLADPVVR